MRWGWRVFLRAGGTKTCIHAVDIDLIAEGEVPGWRFHEAWAHAMSPREKDREGWNYSIVIRNIGRERFYIGLRYCSDQPYKFAAEPGGFCFTGTSPSEKAELEALHMWSRFSAQRLEDRQVPRSVLLRCPKSAVSIRNAHHPGMAL